MNYLLDTDTVVGFLRGQEPVVQKFQMTPAETLAVSAITLAELYHGASRSSRPQHNTLHVRRLENSIQIIDFDAAAAAQFGALRSDLERAGKRLDDLDLLLASTALTRGLTLVTHNLAHFRRVPNLVIEDWMKH